MRHGLLDAVHEHAKHERVDGGADGLVEEEFDDGVADVELGLDQSAFAGFTVEFFFIVGGGGFDCLWGGRGCFGGEGGLKKFLP